MWKLSPDELSKVKERTLEEVNASCVQTRFKKPFKEKEKAVFTCLINLVHICRGDDGQ